MHKEVAAVLTAVIAVCLGQDMSVLCPETVTGELSSDIVVPCNVTGTPYILFWFRGYFTSDNVPIIYLQDGVSGGSEYGKGKYTLTEGGLLVINKITLQEEGPYTLRVISSDGGVSISSSNISIFEPCTGVTDASELHSSHSPKASSGGPLWKVMLGVIFIVITVGVLSLLVYYRRCRVPRKSSVPGASTEENVNKLYKQLIKKYKSHVFHPPSDPASSTRRSGHFIHCQCVIEKRRKGSKIKHATSRKLFERKFFHKYKRVLIEADVGYGKQTFVKEFLKRWVGKQCKNPLLICIKLGEVRSDGDVIRVIRSQFDLGGVLNVEEVDEILQTQECHVLLGGLEDWPRLDPSEFSAFAHNKEHEILEVDGGIVAQETIELMNKDWEKNDRLLVEDLLSNNYTTKYKNLTIWVTGITDKSNSTKFKEYDVSVTFIGMDDDQKKEQGKK